MKSLLNFPAFMLWKTVKEHVLTFSSGLLARRDWIYLLSLLLPLVFYNVTLKVVRISTQLSPPGPLGFVDQLRSDVLFSLGYAIFWVTLFSVFRRGVLRWISLALFHLSALTTVVLVTSTHFFYKTTGSTLDYSFIMFSLSSIDETWKIIGAETSVLHWLLLLSTLFYVLAGPAIVTRILTRQWHLPLWTPGGAWKVSLVAGTAAVFLFALSTLPSTTGVSDTFSRDALVNIALSEINKPDFEKQIETDLVAGKSLDSTSLASTPQTNKRNVVLIFLESTRARSTTPYNEDIETTPFLDELAEESLVAENAYAMVPHTSKALVPGICGMAPPLDTRNTESEPDAIPARCLPELLGEKDYRSAFFQSATGEFERRGQLVENFGYDEFFPIEKMDKKDFEEVNYFGYEDDIMLEPSEEWLKKDSDKPFLATYLTLTPHHDYTVPERYGEKKFSENEELNDYLNTLRYQDRFLGNLFDQYKELGLYEDTVFVIIGDHGEGFGEHGLRQHDNVIYNEGLRVPFLVHDPKNVPEENSIKAPVSIQDILPTVTDLLDYDIEGGTYPGASALNPPENRDLMASCYQENRCLANIKGSKKYIYYYGNKEAEYFDLSEDPLEKENLIEDQSSEKLEELRYNVLSWQAQVESSYEKHLYGKGSED